MCADQGALFRNGGNGGILLYDSGQYKLARRRKLDFAEIREQAQKYFDDKFGRALKFFLLTLDTLQIVAIINRLHFISINRQKTYAHGVVGAYSV